MDENDIKLFKERLNTQENRIYEFQEKFTYYILAINAACIGFSINLTKDDKPSWTLILIILSMILWGISFYLGIKELQTIEKNHKAMYHNTEAAIHDMPDIKAKSFTEVIKHSTDTDKFRTKKMKFLYYGVFAFILWDILNIILKTLN